VVTRSGKHRTAISVEAWLQEATERGAGEILLTSWDQDGTRQGYDLALLRMAAACVNVPIIASGGARDAADMVAALEAGASAVLAASIFHDNDTEVGSLKRLLSKAGLEVRAC
jgi:imidazole glycerol phosphate synthase subunit HisF